MSRHHIIFPATTDADAGAGRVLSMSSPEAFAALGLYVRREFLTPDECETVVAEMLQDVGRSAQVVRGGGEILDETVRRTRSREVPPTVAADLADRLLALMPTLSATFDLPLQHLEAPYWLSYDPGDFFAAHADAAAGSYTGRRQVSVVAFLNDQAARPAAGQYSGGALSFYGLLPGPQWERCGLPLHGATGLLVAFRSQVVHEVLPVTAGTRHTMVTWFR
jgi:SM-20-related protein